ncbi:MAG TPA: tRNA uridine-5-carboxymethylaminomethyl(34) synthesis GTPase MnmE [Vicinamibacterales bacterium]|nr:tRNA uridine-5-carboxymethylaminomethyl(34) synthesis GTPase MnmE [Vicinamibacterales bacterium]
MFSISDTIVAIATPPGRGGIGVVRISGPDAAAIAATLTDRHEPLVPRLATVATFRSAAPHDHVVVTSFARPASYTGEDVVEISAHGSPVILNGILSAAMAAGARLAEPGEFTLRAFLNGKLDLIQAEAVADLIAAVTPLQARAAFDQLEGTLTAQIAAIEQQLFEIVAKLEASLDFPEEGYHFVEPAEARNTIGSVIALVDALLSQAARGRLIREGVQVAIVGAPNVGKSSLFNALLNTNRAIVTAIPGTTRDLLTERADIAGLSLSLIDTAGMRDTVDVVEREGVRRARQAIGVADLTIVMVDASRPLSADDRELLHSTSVKPRVVVLNKIDLPKVVDEIEGVEISAKTGAGIADLIEAISQALGGGETLRDQPSVTNMRHIALLERAKASLTRAAVAFESAVSEEFPLLDLQEARAALEEITGKKTSDDLLRHIFERFCIGK